METIELSTLKEQLERMKREGNDALLQWMIDNIIVGDAKAAWKSTDQYVKHELN